MALCVCGCCAGCNSSAPKVRHCSSSMLATPGERASIDLTGPLLSVRCSCGGGCVVVCLIRAGGGPECSRCQLQRQRRQESKRREYRVQNGEEETFRQTHNGSSSTAADRCTSTGGRVCDFRIDRMHAGYDDFSSSLSPNRIRTTPLTVPLLCSCVSLVQVAPQHAALSASSGGPIQDSKDNQNLSALELQSKGAVRHAVTSRKGLVPYNKNKVNQSVPRSLAQIALRMLLHATCCAPISLFVCVFCCSHCLEIVSCSNTLLATIRACRCGA